MDAYPKRQSHFAHKLVRLMLHSCATQDIGTDGFALVVAIAHAEDAKRYAGAVTYWNEQLMPIIGFQSWGQLDRARKKAIDAGWLHYEGGGKGKVGRYWCVIPDHLSDAPDSSTEADHHVSFSNSGEQNVKEAGTKRERTGGEPGENRGRSGEHSTLSLIPNPVPITNTSCVAERHDSRGSSNGRHRKPAPYSPEFEEFWRAYPPYRRTSKGTAWVAWQKAIRLVDARTLIATATAYAASPRGSGEYSKMPATWLNGRCWEDSPESWGAAPAGAAGDRDIPF